MKMLLYTSFAFGLVGMADIEPADAGRLISTETWCIISFTSAVTVRMKDGTEVRLAGIEPSPGNVNLKRLTEMFRGRVVTCYVSNSRLSPLQYWCSLKDGSGLNNRLVELQVAVKSQD